MPFLNRESLKVLFEFLVYVKLRLTIFESYDSLINE